MSRVRLILFVAAALLGARSEARATLIGHWPLDGNGTALVGTSGTLVNGPTATTDRDGVASGAVAFDGVDDYVSVAGGGGLAGLSTGTIALWVKWTGAQDLGAGAYGPVLARQSNSQFSNDIIGLDGASPAAAKLVWQPYNAGGTVITSPGAVGDGVWRHVAITFGGGTHTMYLDGVSAGTWSGGGAFNGNTAVPLTIGGWIGDGSGYMHGSIDDVRIYDTALAAGDVQQLAGTAAVPEAGSIALAGLALLAARRRRGGRPGR